MKVKAKFAAGKYGFYYNKRRYDGDVFDVKEGDPIGSWMIPLEKPEVKPVEKPKFGKK